MARLGQRSAVVSLLAAYGAWLLSVLLSAIVVWLGRSDVLGLLLLAHVDKYLYALLDEVSFFLLVLGWVIFAIVSESWHSKSRERGTLRRLIRRVDGWLVGILLVELALYFVLL